MKYLPYVRKAVRGLLVCAVALVGAHLLPAEVGTWVQVATPVLVALGVYVAPANADKPQADAPQGVN